VPFPAGGLTDVPARIAATMMSEKIGQNLVVENKTGATGAVLISKEIISTNASIFDGRQIRSLRDISEYFPQIKADQWRSIKGIGEKSAESLVGWFSQQNNLEQLKKMEELGVKVVFQESKAEKQKLAGMTFVLTGELQDFTRDEVKDIIREKGGQVSSSVSRKTAYVLVGENPGSKFDNAKKLGVKIISEKDFMEMIK
jgi:NAD-dependent DNA ligase